LVHAVEVIASGQADKKILREPLLRFLLLGAAIFAAYSLVSKRSSDEPGKIVVTQGQVAAMAEGFARTWQQPPTSEVGKLFGEKFAAALGKLPPGQWQGPIASGDGAHLVFVSERTAGGVPALGEVRDVVRREWANARRLEANEKFYQFAAARQAANGGWIN
jgi:hypothetical protein